MLVLATVEGVEGPEAFQEVELTFSQKKLMKKDGEEDDASFIITQLTENLVELDKKKKILKI